LAVWHDSFAWTRFGSRESIQRNTLITVAGDIVIMITVRDHDIGTVIENASGIYDYNARNNHGNDHKKQSSFELSVHGFKIRMDIGK